MLQNSHVVCSSCWLSGGKLDRRQCLQFVWEAEEERPRGSRCVNKTLIKAEGPEHQHVHTFPPLLFVELIPAHLLIIGVPWPPLLPPCRATCYNSGSVGCQRCGITLPSVLLLCGLTAEPKSNASLSRIMGYPAWFASFPSLLLPVSKMSQELLVEVGRNDPELKVN